MHSRIVWTRNDVSRTGMNGELSVESEMVWTVECYGKLSVMDSRMV